MAKITLTCLLTFFVVGFWSLVAPLFEFPDEQAHFATANYLYYEGDLPQDKDRRVSQDLGVPVVTNDLSYELATTEKILGTYRDKYGNNLVTYHPEYRLPYSSTLVGFQEQIVRDLSLPSNQKNYVGQEAARYPRLYYLYESFWYGLTADTDIMMRTIVLRLGNVLILGLTSFFVYQTGILLFGQVGSALLLTMMVALQPMFSFISAGINSDNLHNLFFTIIIYSGVYLLRRGPSIFVGLLLPIALLGDFLTKPQGFIAIPIVVSALIIWFLSSRIQPRILLLVAILGAAIIFVSRSLWGPYINLVFSPNTSHADFTSFLHFSLNKLIAQNSVWYWGVFKWLGVVLPPPYWQVANRLVLLGGFGLFVYFYKVVRHQKVLVPLSIISYLLLAVVIYTLAIYWFDWQHFKEVGYSIGIQSRYFFPTILAQMALLLTGILSLGWNDTSRLWLRRMLLVFFIWLQLGGIWRLVTSYYDTSSLSTFITQASQYKPLFAKGNWWYLWLGIYLASLTVLFFSSWAKSSSMRQVPPRLNPKVTHHHHKLD